MYTLQGFQIKSKSKIGRAIAQAVSRWFPTAAAWVQTRIQSCEICGGQSGAGSTFSPSISVSLANLHSTNLSTITIGYHLGLVQYVISSSSTKSHPTNKKKFEDTIFTKQSNE
jgi:hypothetical protein